jgi:hypothetical protein
MKIKSVWRAFLAQLNESRPRRNSKDAQPQQAKKVKGLRKKRAAIYTKIVRKKIPHADGGGHLVVPTIEKLPRPGAGSTHTLGDVTYLVGDDGAWRKTK